MNWTNFPHYWPFIKGIVPHKSTNCVVGLDKHLINRWVAGDLLTLALTHWGRHKMAAIFADDIFKWIFSNENVWISIKISLKFAPRGPISNIPALVQIMAWHRPGDKPLSEPMKVSLLTYICVTQPQWVKGIKNGCPRIVEIRGMQGCPLVGDTARAVGECRDVAKAQP